MPFRIMQSRIVTRVEPYKLIRELVKRAGGSLPVARAMGDPGFQPTLNKIVNGKVPSPTAKSAERIASHFGIPLQAVWNEDEAQRVWDQRFPDPSEKWPREVPNEVSHRMSHLPATMIATTTWEAIMEGTEIPELFMLALRDQSLGDELPKGTRLIWQRSRNAEPGDVVLVRDGDGEVYARLVHEGTRRGHFLAAPASPAFRTLDSHEHKLEILAVKVGRMDR